MKKIVIFNVGGALSAYAEFNDKKVIIDIGAGSGFSPVDNFLIPLSEHNKFTRHTDDRFYIDQLFLSHLDNDHISDYPKFVNQFYVNYMTCPNDNDEQSDDFKVNRELLGEQNDTRNLVLNEMKSRNPVDFDNPLASIVEEISLFYIKPKACESTEDLASGYANNISLVLFLHVGNKTLLLPGDILKDGMTYLIDGSNTFKNLLSDDGVDYLIAPHHGLQTSFSQYLFDNIDGKKTRLNIISEKIRESDSAENRSDVDGRYYSSEYSTGENSLSQNAVKTSGGHIVIDFETEETEIKQYESVDSVIEEFID